MVEQFSLLVKNFFFAKSALKRFWSNGNHGGVGGLFVDEQLRKLIKIFGLSRTHFSNFSFGLFEPTVVVAVNVVAKRGECVCYVWMFLEQNLNFV